MSRRGPGCSSDAGRAEGGNDADERQRLGGCRGHGVDDRGQVEVLGGQAAGVVGREREGDLVVADEDVGVVLEAFGILGQAIDKGHRLKEVLEPEGALDGFAGLGPCGCASESRLNFRIGHPGHA